MSKIGIEASLRPPPPLDLKGSNDLHILWKNWKKSFENYVEATGLNDKEVTDKRRVAILLNLLSDDAMEIFNTFEYAEGEKPEVLKDVLQKFEKYCLPKVNQTVERFNFFQVAQKEGENFDTFLTTLRTAAVTCDFGEQKDSLIRDRIICGIRDRALQRRLLRETDVTLKKVVEMCRVNEISDKQVKILQETVEVSAVKKRLHQSNKTNKDQAEPSDTLECKFCGYKHQPRKCPAYGQQCRNCKGLNHFAKMCKKSAVNEVSENYRCSDNNEQFEVDQFFIDEISKKPEESGKAWYVDLKVKGTNVKFKLDTGAEVNIISKRILEELHLDVDKTRTTLTSFGEFTVKPIGEINLMCERDNGRRERLNFIVVDVTSTPLLGLPGCRALDLVRRVDIVQRDKLLESIEEEFKEVFTGVGEFPFEYDIKIRPNAKPVVHPPRKVPFAIHDKLKSTLKELVKLGIIAKVDKPTEWVNSLVIVEKKDGSLRLCLDPSDLNEYIMREQFKMSTTEDVAARMNGKKIFTVLDMKDGFWQLKLTERSTDLCVFNTPFGRFKFLRLAFGLAPAPEVFQERVEQTFGDIEGVSCVADDIIIASENEEEHDKLVKRVLQRAKENNVKFNKKKMKLRLTEVPYVGHIFSKDGLKPDPEKIRAITNMDEPTNKDELRRFLGTVNYLARFIPNISSITAPLRVLLKEDTEWTWGCEQSEAVKILKDKLTTAPVLVFYDPKKPLTVQTDASKHGLGAALLQDSHPIAYASRSLTETEQRYAPIEKELLAIVFGMQHFHQYVYGVQVTIHTDHKPLVTIVKKDINKVSGRMQLMLLKLMRYNLTVQYVPGKQMFLADTLSRAFLRTPVCEDTELNAAIHSVSKHLAVSPAKRKAIQQATKSDEALQKLIQYNQNGWPEYIQNVALGVEPYWNYREVISVDDDMVFMEDRLVVPTSMRSEMLRILHEGHLGEEKCKKNARSLLFWPGMSSQIESMVSGCSTCQQFRRSNRREPLISHEIPMRPWVKVAADILEFGGTSYLVVVDYYSKWVELLKLERKTADVVIYKLKEVFSRLGVPEQLVSDNMPFNSYQFKTFAKEWDIELTTSSPRYPQSNGMAERAVQIAKNMLRKVATGNADLFTMLLDYRNTPVKGMSISPSQLCAGRRLRTKIPVLTRHLSPKLPTGVKKELQDKQAVQKYYYDRSARNLPELNVGDKVLLKRDKTLEPAKVTAKHPAPRSFVVTTSDGGEYRRNRSQLVKPKSESLTFYMDPVQDPFVQKKQPAVSGRQESPSHSEIPFESTATNESEPADEASHRASGVSSDYCGPSLRSRASIKPPGRFDDFVKY